MKTANFEKLKDYYENRGGMLRVKGDEVLARLPGAGWFFLCWNTDTELAQQILYRQIEGEIKDEN